MLRVVWEMTKKQGEVITLEEEEKLWTKKAKKDGEEEDGSLEEKNSRGVNQDQELSKKAPE